METIDLSVKVKDVTFRNPIIPGSSDIVLDERGVVKCIEQGIGGILSKSFTSAEPRTRARPYHFNYKVFGKAFENNWISRGGAHVLPPKEAAEKLIPRWARFCKNEGIPLILSLADSDDVEEWVRDAKIFEDAGADMLELNFGCPHAHSETDKRVTASLAEDLPLVKEIISSVKKAVKIPAGAKLGIIFYPFVHHVKGWMEAGIDFLTCHNSISGMLIDVEQETPFGGLGAGGYEIGRGYLALNLGRTVEVMKLTGDLPIFASGGVWESRDAIMYLLIGCTVVEVCQAVFKNGYRLFGETIKGIEQWMERKGYTSINDFRGKVRNLASKSSRPDLMPMEWPFPMPQEKSSPVIPMIDMDKCILCEKCQDFCLSGVFIVDKGKEKVEIDHENKCWGCGDCVGWCPVNAIKLIDKKTGKVIWDGLSGLAQPYRPENWISH
jgi:dihydroorotate dehydrogenase/NAD-dependent dihydropyrimidine dehydrogenase PreA subunit